MANGEVYAQVDASVVNGGIAPMAMVSGNPTPVDGQSYVVVWIRWRYDDTTGDGGYTGQSWYFGDPNNGLTDYTEDSFESYLIEHKPTDLNSILEGWDPAQKAAFLNTHLNELEAGGCLYFTGGTQ